MKTHLSNIRALLFSLFALALAAAPARADLFTASFNGSGVWQQDGAVWSTVAYPSNGHSVPDGNGGQLPGPNPTYNVVINNPAPCTLGIGVTVQGVTVANGSTLNVGNNALIVANAPFVDNGLVTLNSSGGGDSRITVGDGSGVSATGKIVMTNSPTNYISAVNHGNTFTIQPGGSITGAGQLNLGYFGDTHHLLNYVNQGLIDATQLNALQIGMGGQAGVNANLTNTGTLRASNGGTLRIHAFNTFGTVFNTGGTITALDGSTVRIISGATVSGGTLTTSGTGAIRGDAAGGTGGVLSDLTNTGTVAIADQESLTLAGTVTNNGIITLNSVGNNAILRFANGATLAGTGTVTLSNNGSNYIMAVNGGEAFTIAPTATIQGTGNISPGFSGGSNMAKITNQGLIHANNANSALVIRAESFNNTPFTNSGTLRASNGATLFFNGSSTLTNNGGTLHVLPNSTISGSGGIALLQTAGTIDLDGGAMNFPLGVDLNGGTLVGNGTFTGPIRNNGGIVGPGHSPGKIIVNGNYIQGPNGVLNMEIGGTVAGTEYDQLQVSGTATLGGTLNVSLINGFRPAVGAVFQIIAPSSFAGAFATINTIGFTAQVNYSNSAITLTVQTVPDIPLNISSRLNVGLDPNVLIAGFIVQGTEPKKIIIRALGPSLSLGGVPVAGRLANPFLELHDGTNAQIAANDDWQQAPNTNEIPNGFAPSDSRESVIVTTLAPGAYTAVVRGAGNTTGIGVVELYDLGATAKSKLANISSRGLTQQGDDVLIGGFIIGGSGAANSRLVVRALGPSLSAFGITGALQDPTLEVKNGNGTTLLSNDDWQGPQGAEIQGLGLAPTDPRESAVVLSVPDGNYTAIVRGKGSATGVAVVEVYNVL